MAVKRSTGNAANPTRSSFFGCQLREDEKEYHCKLDKEFKEHVILRTMCLDADTREELHTVEIEAQNKKMMMVNLASLQPNVVNTINLGGYELRPPFTFRLTSGSGPVYISGQHFIETSDSDRPGPSRRKKNKRKERQSDRAWGSHASSKEVVVHQGPASPHLRQKKASRTLDGSSAPALLSSSPANQASHPTTPPPLTHFRTVVAAAPFSRSPSPPLHLAPEKLPVRSMVSGLSPLVADKIAGKRKRTSSEKPANKPTTAVVPDNSSEVEEQENNSSPVKRPSKQVSFWKSHRPNTKKLKLVDDDDGMGTTDEESGSDVYEMPDLPKETIDLTATDNDESSEYLSDCTSSSYSSPSEDDDDDSAVEIIEQVSSQPPETSCNDPLASPLCKPPLSVGQIKSRIKALAVQGHVLPKTQTDFSDFVLKSYRLENEEALKKLWNYTEYIVNSLHK